MSVPAPSAQRAHEPVLALFKQRRRTPWQALADEIQEAIASVRERGWCAAAWQPEVVALSAPLACSPMPLVVNVSVSTSEPLIRVARDLAPKLLDMALRIDRQILAGST